MKKIEKIETRKTVAFFNKRDNPYEVDVNKIILLILPGATLVFRCFKKEEYKHNKEGVENHLYLSTLRLMDVDIAKALFSFGEMEEIDPADKILRARTKIKFSGKMEEIDNAKWIHIRHHEGKPYIYRVFTLGQQYPNREKGEAIFSRTELMEWFIIIYK